MNSLFQIDEIVSSPSKVGILRVLTSGKGFKGTGREISRLAGFSVPATHESLKDLYARNILTLEIIGKQHIYALNEEDRSVQKFIRPMFKVEAGLKNEICIFIKDLLLRNGILNKISSLILYGSFQTKKTVRSSDIDIAVVVNKTSDVDHVAEVFVSDISVNFKKYFGVQLDPYVKSASEFRKRLKKLQPPIANLMKSFTVLYGKEPLEV